MAKIIITIEDSDLDIDLAKIVAKEIEDEIRNGAPDTATLTVEVKES